MSEVKHTPLPWETPTDVGPYKSSTIIRGANGQTLIIIDPGRIRDLPYEEMVANSEFIVRACNVHYEMLEACKFSLDAVLEYCAKHGDYTLANRLKDVIYRAKGDS